ncbi:MAG: hypothetical protein FWE17_02870, partial [Alphaproteobacteria bacterium]|nr:hypothetical protein [Alphaproteobacteria bacterium]
RTNLTIAAKYAIMPVPEVKMTQEDPEERKHFINQTTLFFYNKVNIHGKRGKTTEIHVADTTNAHTSRHLANVHMSFADNPRGTAVVVHGYNSSVFSPATNLSALANECGLDYAFVEVVKHSILAKPEFENLQHCNMRNLEELRLGIYRGLREIRKDRDLCRARRIAVAHSMGARAASDLMLSGRTRDMFCEYIISEGYVLTSPSIVTMKKKFGEKITKRGNIKYGIAPDDTPVQYLSIIRDMILPHALPLEKEMEFDGPIIFQSGTRVLYTERFIKALFDTHNFYKVIGKAPVHFIFAGNSEAIEREDAGSLFKHFNGADKTMHVIPGAMHNFTTDPKSDLSRDAAPTRYRQTVAELFANFACKQHALAL